MATKLEKMKWKLHRKKYDIIKKSFLALIK